MDLPPDSPINSGDQPESQNPKPTPQVSSAIPQSVADRLSRPPTFVPSDAAKFDRLISTLDQIRYLNDHIRINTDKMSTFLSEHMKDLRTTKSLVQDEKQRQEIEPAYTRTNLLHTQRKLFDTQREETLRTLTQPNADPLIELKKLGMVNEKNEIVLGKTKIKPDDVSSIVKDIQSGNTNELAEAFNKKLTTSLTKNIAAQATPEEIQLAKNLQNISTGHGTLGRLAERFHFGHGVSLGVPMRRPLGASGGGGGAGFESAEGLYEGHEVEPTELSRTARIIGNLARRGGVVGGIGRGAAGALGGAGAMGDLIPGIGEALIAVGLLQHFGRDIPIIGPGIAQGQQMVNERFGREALATGQITGEGRGAGFQAQQAAFGLTPGGQFGTIAGYNLAGLPVVGGIARKVGGLLHPFDPITNEIADEIVQSVRTQGFTGPRANELYKGVADVYRDLGLSIDTTTKMITEATRNGGESLRQIVTEMKSFDTAAKDLHVNINDYAQSIMQTSEMFRAGGAGASATQMAQQFVAGAPQILRSGAGLQSYTQAFQNATPILSAQLGLPQQYLQLQENQGQVLPAFETAMDEEIARMPGQNTAEKAANASRFGIIFKGMGVDQITAILRQNASGRGPLGQARLTNIANQYGQAAQRLQGTRLASLRSLSQSQMERRGYHISNIDERGRPIYETAQGKTVNLDQQVTVQGDIHDANTRQLASIRQQAINQAVSQHLLSKKQQQELEKHVGDANYGFKANLMKLTRQGGTGNNEINTPFGRIIIQMKGKAEKAFTATVEQNQRAVQYGNAQSNQQYPYSDSRFTLDPLGG